MPIFKKILSRDSLPNEVLSNGSFCALKPELQERLSNGVKYNLKVVIRGERKTGKSSLLSRLKGEEFSSNYIPTDEIKVACILWNYQPTNDAVKVDIWDVVDKGRQREVKHGTTAPGYVSKLTKKSQATKAMASLDSTFIDVYKGANCVILIFDITNKLTFEYVRRELPKVPHSVPVLVIGNYRDAATGDNESHREISESDARAFVRQVAEARQAASVAVTPSEAINISDIRNMYKCAPIRYCETSMRNGFGLMYIHRFLNIPFLHLQCSYLIQALVANRQAFSSISQQLDSAEEKQEIICSYEKFTHWLESSRRHPVLSPNRQGNPSLSTTTTNQVGPGALKISTSEELNVSKTERAPESSLPSNSTGVKSSHDFLNRSDDPQHPLVNKDVLNGEDAGTTELPVSETPLVAAFQEDLDPDDTAANMAALSLGLNGSIASPHQSPRFPPLADSVEDDDDDLMNEDSDDDEEHLGPALGLISTSSVNEDDQPQLFQVPSSRTSTTTSSPSSESSSNRASLEVDSTSPSPTVQKPSVDPFDLSTIEERKTFERFLDDI